MTGKDWPEKKMNLGRRDDLKTQGWKQCLYSVVKSRKAREFPSQRTAFTRKGQRCSKLVSPKAIKRLGIAICNVHEAPFLKDIEEDEKRRQELREKYDPGPLPLEGIE